MPSVSVILSVYRSEATLQRSLEALRRQTFRDFEVIIIDSSPDTDCEQIVMEKFPEFLYVHHPDRLSVDAARNLGLEKSPGTLVGSTDPDAYSSEHWLTELVAAHDRRGGLVIGSVACFGDRWLDRGAHLSKFDKWLAGGPARTLTEGPTVNMLVSSQLINRAGGFMGRNQGDTDLCWRAREQGSELWFAPEAVVEHHHLHSWRSLLRERYGRGKKFGNLWLSWHPVSNVRLGWRHVITLLPVRLTSQLLRVGKNAAQAGMLREYVLVFPLVATGLYARLLGEASVFSGRILSRSVGRTA